MVNSLNTAFNLNSSYVETIEVYNSASTTKFNNNQYACENTNDNVYLLSYKDYLNVTYKYSTSIEKTETRQFKITDYANANGKYYSETYWYCGYYWTRSPDTYGTNYMGYVYHDGFIKGLIFTANEGVAIRPAITIKLKT